MDKELPKHLSLPPALAMTLIYKNQNIYFEN